MLMTILSSLLGGGLMRLLPEAVTLLNKLLDNNQEFRMLDKQIELEKLKQSGAQQMQQAQLDSSQILALLDAQKAAVTSQMQKVGIAFVDALNFLVRPLATYYFLLMYGAVKVATLVIAMHQVDAWHAILQCWSEEDAAILSGILSFWFVGRVFDKQRR